MWLWRNLLSPLLVLALGAAAEPLGTGGDTGGTTTGFEEPGAVATLGIEPWKALISSEPDLAMAFLPVSHRDGTSEVGTFVLDDGLFRAQVNPVVPRRALVGPMHISVGSEMAFDVAPSGSSRSGDGAWHWHGRLRGEEYGIVELTWYDDFLFGEISSSMGEWQVHTLSSDLVVISEYPERNVGCFVGEGPSEQVRGAPSEQRSLPSSARVASGCGSFHVGRWVG